MVKVHSEGLRYGQLKMGHPPHDAESHTFDEKSSHFLLLLSDSALPLGSFAFSSGLESFLAHYKSKEEGSLKSFLSRSLLSLASTSIPFVFATHRRPNNVLDLDSEQDACLLCNVSKRASTAQGRALMTLWERSLRDAIRLDHPAAEALQLLSKSMRQRSAEIHAPSGHFAPIWGAVTCALGLAEGNAAYLFLYNHVKSVLSAAVRANVVGPYHAHKFLAGEWVRREIKDAIDHFQAVETSMVGQTWPSLDLWLGRHERLYSRMFNS